MREAKTCMQAVEAPSRAPPSLHNLPTVCGSQGPACWALWLERQGCSFLGLPGTYFERVPAQEGRRRSNIMETGPMHFRHSLE